jgi:lipoprotein signal peptidase
MEEPKATQPKQNGSKKYLPFVFLFLAFILADQVSKIFATSIFRNYVFAFSLPLPEYLIYLVYAIVLVAIGFYVVKNRSQLSTVSNIAWTLVLSGAVSNIFERIFLGYVRDFIYISFYHFTGIYNLADFFIIAGIILLLSPEKE